MELYRCVLYLLNVHTQGARFNFVCLGSDSCDTVMFSGCRRNIYVTADLVDPALWVQCAEAIDMQLFHRCMNCTFKYFTCKNSNNAEF